MASTVGPNMANKQWNRERKGDGYTADRRSNINGSNGISGRASSKEYGNKNGNRKSDGHTVMENSIAKGSYGATAKVKSKVIES